MAHIHTNAKMQTYKLSRLDTLFTVITTDWSGCVLMFNSKALVIVVLRISTYYYVWAMPKYIALAMDLDTFIIRCF